MSVIGTRLKVVRPIALIFLCLLMGFAIAGCGPSKPTLKTITISPSSATIAPDGQITFSATAKDSDGKVMDNVDFEWSVSPASFGTITQNGVFRAPTTLDTGKVVVSASGVVAEATITVKMPDDGDDPGNGDTYTHDAGVIADDVTWKADRPHVITGDVRIENNGILRIEAGAVIRFNSSATITIGEYSTGTVKANGTAAKPIVLTTSRLPASAGAWGGVFIGPYTNTTETILNNVKIDYAGGYPREAAITIDSGAIPNLPLKINNTVVQNSAKYGVYAIGNSSFATTSANLTIKDCSDYLIKISPAYAHTIPSTGCTYAPTNGKGFLLDGPTDITTDVTWSITDVKYDLDDDVSICGDNGCLRLSPGVTVRVGMDQAIRVGSNTEAGSLIAVGTPEKEITITSKAAVPAPGDYDGIIFSDHAIAGSTLRYVTVEYGGKEGAWSSDGNISILRSDEGSGPDITNCIIRHSANYGIYGENLTTDYTSGKGNVFSDNARGNQNQD